MAEISRESFKLPKEFTKDDLENLSEENRERFTERFPDLVTIISDGPFKGITIDDGIYAVNDIQECPSTPLNKRTTVFFSNVISQNNNTMNQLTNQIGHYMSLNSVARNLNDTFESFGEIDRMDDDGPGY